MVSLAIENNDAMENLSRENDLIINTKSTQTDFSPTTFESVSCQTEITVIEERKLLDQSISHKSDVDSDLQHDIEDTSFAPDTVTKDFEDSKE